MRHSGVTDIVGGFFQDATKAVDNAIKDYEKQSVRYIVFYFIYCRGLVLC